MKWLKIIALGMVVWALSLVWLDVNLVLTLSVAIGLAMAIPVYFLGRYLGQLRSGYKAEHNFCSRQTRPARVTRTPFYAHSRQAHPTMPMTFRHSKSIHSRPTRRMLLGLHR